MIRFFTTFLRASALMAIMLGMFIVIASILLSTIENTTTVIVLMVSMGFGLAVAIAQCTDQQEKP